MTDLQPTDEWKSMVIAGLAPETIMDICNRSLNFWIYQTCQEQCYQESVIQDLQSKLWNYEKQLESVNLQSKADLATLHERIQGKSYITAVLSNHILIYCYII
jgi:E3 ubiquitin-protein ligase CCNP1IP1